MLTVNVHTILISLFFAVLGNTFNTIVGDSNVDNVQAFFGPPPDPSHWRWRSRDGSPDYGLIDNFARPPSDQRRNNFDNTRNDDGDGPPFAEHFKMQPRGTAESSIDSGEDYSKIDEDDNDVNETKANKPANGMNTWPNVAGGNGDNDVKLKNQPSPNNPPPPPPPWWNDSNQKNSFQYPPPMPMGKLKKKSFNDHDDDNDDDDEHHKKDNGNVGLRVGLGVGISVGVVIILVAMMIFACWRWRRNKKKVSLFGSHGRSILSSTTSSGSSNGSNSYIDRLPTVVEDVWAMDRRNVIVDYETKLGSGAFCNVHKGRIKGPAAVRAVTQNLIAIQKFTDCEIAIKLLPPFADDIARSDFMQEINFMKSLNYHPHLVSMLGYVPASRNPLLLVEYCAQGDLLHFVREHRAAIEHGYENGAGLKILSLVSFAWQISAGLEYLNSVGCIHRDVAARNVLLDADQTCKIADFGLCRLTDNLLYTARGGRLPIRWMALESLKSFEYSFKSDTWAYGVLLWELTSLGLVPYTNVENNLIMEHLEAGNRLDKPVHCPKEIYELMECCWRADPESRPSFTEICEYLRKVLENAAPDYGYLMQEPPNASDDHVDDV